MGARLGADPPRLGELAASMRGGADLVERAEADLSRRARSLAWHGRDAERFATEWQTRHRPALAALSATLRREAARLERHRTEQLAASEGTGSAVAPVRHGGSGADRPSPAGSPTIAGPPPPPPLVADRYVGGLEVRVGPAVATIGGVLTLGVLADGRVRVTAERRGGVGAAAGAGSTTSLSVSDGPAGSAPASDRLADASAMASLLERRTWEVPAGEVDELLRALAVEQAVLSATGRRDPAGDVGEMLDGVVRRLTGVDPGLSDRLGGLGPPPPTSVDQLVEGRAALAGGAGLGAGLLGNGSRSMASGRLDATGSLRAGSVQRGGVDTPVLEADGAVAAAATGTLLGRLGVSLADGPDHAVTSRWELSPPTPGGDRELLVVATATTDGGTDRVAARVRLSGRSGTAIVAALDHLAAGRVADGVRSLASAPVDPGSAAVRIDRGEVDRTTVSGGAALAAGPGAGVSARGAVERVSFVPTG